MIIKEFNIQEINGCVLPNSISLKNNVKITKFKKGTKVNNELINPLFHGEISTINNFFKIKKNINPKNCIFISSHEPCSLCLSGITWSGFTNFIYLYPYQIFL